MQIPTPTLTESRRAGLLAAVAVYPLTRLAGTLHRPTVDRALVSGASMATAYASASATTKVVGALSGALPGGRVAKDVRTAVALGAVAVGAGVVAAGLRHRARVSAEHEERLPVPAAALGSAAEIVTISAGAGAAIAAADAVGSRLPEQLLPRSPLVSLVGVITAGAALAAASRHPRVLGYFTLPPHEGSPEHRLHFQSGASLPIAIGRAAGVAGATVAALALENLGAEAIARALDRTDDPAPVALLGGHAIIVGGFALAGVAGLAFYSSRVEVQERLLEAAYAAVPERRGVTGGPESAYDFGDLGREGRRFISQAYTATELEQALGRPAQDPVRALLPLSAQTGDLEHDAALLVEEVERLGGFAKGTIVLAAPTGDGYVSYVQTESVELLTAGDCATVTVPYAQVPSALAMPKRKQASVAYAAYARALSARARVVNPGVRLCLFGESLGSIVALDAFGPDIVDEAGGLGFAHGLYAGVPIYSAADRALRPRHPSVRESRGLQYATGREQADDVKAGHLNLTHPTDPVALADVTSLVRHQVDYWGRPTGTHVPVVSFLIELADVKNAMNLRPGEFTPSPGHDYRFETGLAVARAYGLDWSDEERVETALRERELAWSVRRLLARRIGVARDGAVAQLQKWGVDPGTLRQRFGGVGGPVPDWVDSLVVAEPRS